MTEGLMCGVLAVLIMVVIYLGYEDAQKPTFELKKDEWVCSESHMEMFGKTMMTVCDQYTRAHR